MTLLDELAEDQFIECLVCRYLKTLTIAEQTEWDTAFQSRKTISTFSLRRALTRRGVAGGVTSVGRHRREHYGSR